MILNYRFCVDDPYDDDLGMVDISKIFHSVLVGGTCHHDYLTVDTSQDYSVITTDITEDNEVFKQELENNNDGTEIMDGTDSKSSIDRMDMETEASDGKFIETEQTETEVMAQFKSGENVLDWDYQTMQKGSLIRHIKSVHEEVKYSSPHCDYQATAKGNLKAHVQSVHEGVKHFCPHCDYQATTKSYLKAHVQSVHEGVKYSCPHCDYQATTKGHLKTHMHSVHDGTKHSCPHCDYQATAKGNLKAHVQFVHEGV